VTARDYAYQFREPAHLSEKEMKARVLDLQREARARLAALGKHPRLRVLLTGATGFLGKEILAQAASHPHVVEVVSVVRPETIRDRKTKKVLKVLSARERGAALLKRIHVSGKAARKFRFVEGDVERPGFGIDPAELERLRGSLTHVVHCAASVSFDDTYENSFRANVLGCKNALAFSLRLQRAKGSKFVLHVAIETSYIHGRKKRSMATEATAAAFDSPNGVPFSASSASLARPKAFTGAFTTFVSPRLFPVRESPMTMAGSSCTTRRPSTTRCWSVSIEAIAFVSS
jgi:hypothetical protein